MSHRANSFVLEIHGCRNWIIKQVVIIFVYVGSKLKIKWISTDRKIAGSSDWWVGSAWNKKYTSPLLFYHRFLPLGKMYVTCYQYSLPSKIS